VKRLIFFLCTRVYLNLSGLKKNGRGDWKQGLLRPCLGVTRGEERNKGLFYGERVVKKRGNYKGSITQERALENS